MQASRLFVLCLIILLCLTGCIAQFLYEIRIDHLDLPKSSDTLFDYGTVRARKYNRTQYVVDGYFDNLIPFSDDIYAVLDFFGYSGNDYVKIFQRNITAMCKCAQNEPVILDGILKQTSLGVHPKCPVPPGRVHLYNTQIPLGPLFAWMTMFKKYRFNFTYYIYGKSVSSFAIYLVKEEVKFLG